MVHASITVPLPPWCWWPIHVCQWSHHTHRSWHLPWHHPSYWMMGVWGLPNLHLQAPCLACGLLGFFFFLCEFIVWPGQNPTMDLTWQSICWRPQCLYLTLYLVLQMACPGQLLPLQPSTEVLFRYAGYYWDPSVIWVVLRVECLNHKCHVAGQQAQVGWRRRLRIAHSVTKERLVVVSEAACMVAGVWVWCSSTSCHAGSSVIRWFKIETRLRSQEQQ